MEMRRQVIIKCAKEGILSIGEADEMFRTSKDSGNKINRMPLIEVNDEESSEPENLSLGIVLLELQFWTI